MNTIDTLIKDILGRQRISIDMYEKLITLRKEDVSQDPTPYLRLQNAQGEDERNFFLDDADFDKGFHQMDMDQDGQVSKNNGSSVSERESENTRLKRQELEAEQGYFLQPLYVQNLQEKLYIYDDLVREMTKEFQDRLKKKREAIQRIKRKYRDVKTKDVTVVCKVCRTDVQLLHRVKYISPELHMANSPFGMLKRVEIEAIDKAKYDDPIRCVDNLQFYDLHVDPEEGVFKTMETGKRSN